MSRPVAKRADKPKRPGKPKPKAGAQAGAGASAARQGRPVPKTKKFGAKKLRHKRHPQAAPRAKSFDGPPKREAPAALPAMSDVQTEFSRLDGVQNRTAAVLAKSGIDAPFPIQTAVIPLAVRGNDMLVQSPTGSGKTLAFGIPIVEQTKARTTRPVALILTPTRELAVQVSEDLTAIAQSKLLDVVPVYGGAPIVAQARRAAKAAIIVATPGRLADLMRSRSVDVSGIRIVVLDEADRMLDMGFQPQVDEIVEKIHDRKQTMLFSATLEGAVGKIAKAYTTNPETVRNTAAVGGGGKIDHQLLATQTNTKVDTVLDALHDGERDLAIIFVRTQRGADRLCQRLRDFGMRSTVIHGGMNQSQRLREYRRFQSGVCDTLVATDVFSRGMDLDRVTHVINYDIPEDADTYQHRTGRTGRAGRTGIAITLVLKNQTRTMKKMLCDAGIGADVQVGQASGKQWKPVPEDERFTDRMVAREEKRNARGPSKKKRPGAPDEKPARSKDRFAGRRKGNKMEKATPIADGYGVILNFDDKKGFGFIKPSRGGDDVFFHRSAVKGDMQSIPKGAKVSFQIDRNGKTTDRAGVVAVEGGGGNDRPRGPRKHPRKNRS